MTREEAIEEINKVFEPAFANYIIIALTEGVTASDKALKQEPCEDCVSREAVLKLTRAERIFPRLTDDVIPTEENHGIPQESEDKE